MGVGPHPGPLDAGKLGLTLSMTALLSGPAKLIDKALLLC